MSTFSNALFKGSVVFNIPPAAGDYAQEKLRMSHPSLVLSIVRPVIDVQLPAGALIEVFILRDGGDPSVDSDYLLAFTLISGTQRFQASSIYSQYADIRAKSGGAGGAVGCHAVAV